MSDELLPYYQRELAYIRKMGGKFADANPKIAARLRIAADTCEDPHVERMIEGFAYLTARIRHKLDDDFPELSDAMLGVLYPHYLAPVPSMAMVQFVLDRSQGELTSGYTVARGASIETEPIDGEPCRFQTCYPVTLWPIELESASLSGRPFTAPATPYSSQAAGVLKLELRCMSKDVNFGQLALQSLRFFLKGQDPHVYDLFELIHNNTLEIALASSPRDNAPVLLDRRKIRTVGFERDEGMLPYTARSFLGYRLLTEFFAFPRKFLFFELADMGGKHMSRVGNKLEIYFYLNRTTSDLEHNVDAATFRMGCTPIVNLFRQQAEPIELSHTQTEYHIVPDKRRPLATELYSVDRVSATSAKEQAEFAPFYSFKHGTDASTERKFWYASRKPVPSGDDLSDTGTEVSLTLVDLDFKPSSPADWTMHVETTCLNRDLPYRLPFGGDQPRLQLTEGAPLCRLVCLTQPTPTLRPALKHGAVWRLISQLTLNHLSLTEGTDAAQSLQEILKLYDFADSSETRAMIEGILNVQSRRVVGRAPGHGAGGFCRGVEVAIHFSEPSFSGGGLYLFAAVLERFLGMYCSINSFSRLVATTTHREGVLRRWPPRAGEKILL
jgi:type VI secretion system protein ImpG